MVWLLLFNCVTIWEIIWKFLKNTGLPKPIQDCHITRNFSSLYILQRIENLIIYRNLHKIVIATLSMIVKCESNWWMGDQSVVSSYKGILSDHKAGLSGMGNQSMVSSYNGILSDIKQNDYLEWVTRAWLVQTMAYYLTIKQNDCLVHAPLWMNFEWWC